MIDEMMWKSKQDPQDIEINIYGAMIGFVIGVTFCIGAIFVYISIKHGIGV